MSLIQNSDKTEDENGGTKIRMETLTALCKMYPQAAYVIRSKCVCITNNFLSFIKIALAIFTIFFSPRKG